jgi:hypothetical protein
MGLKQTLQNLVLDGGYSYALHIVTYELGEAIWLNDEKSMTTLINVAIGLIHLGADMDFTWNSRSPLVNLTSYGETEDTDLQVHLQNLRIAIELWDHVLRASRVDIPSYVRREQEMLSKETSSIIQRGANPKLKLCSLSYDESSEQWDLEVDTIRTINIYELQSIPGAWPLSMPRIGQIHWSPLTREKEEGVWRKVRRIVLQSHTWSVVVEPQQGTHLVLEGIVADIQDDHDIIMLQANRWQHRRGLHRSCSMPNLLRPLNPRQIDNAYAMRSARPWLPSMHICPHDGKLRFNCYNADQDLDHQDARECVYGTSISADSLQETSDWWRWHFDGDESRWVQKEWRKERPVDSDESSFLTDDGRWVSTETWKTIKVCEERLWR